VPVRSIDSGTAASLLAAVIVLTAPLGGCVSTKCTTAACAADAKITASVQTLLAQRRDLGPPNQVHVDTRAGVVYLSGQVATDLQRREAEDVARQASDVSKVVNNIALMYGSF
jgi:osmotically-inducible protein OsmY